MAALRYEQSRMVVGENMQSGPDARTAGAGMERIRGNPGPRGQQIAALVFALLISLSVALPADAAAELELIPDPLVLISLLVLFLVLIYPLNTLIFRPIFDALDERHRRTVGARERSEEVSRQTEEVLQRYRSELRVARIEAERIRKAAMEEAREGQAQLIAEARSSAEAKVEEGRAKLSATLVEARGELESHARELAQAAAQRVMGRAL